MPDERPKVEGIETKSAQAEGRSCAGYVTRMTGDLRRLYRLSHFCQRHYGVSRQSKSEGPVALHKRRCSRSTDKYNHEE